jgi:hypothetical protein
MAGSQSSDATGTGTDGGEAGTQVVNQKYPLWAHVRKVSADASGAGGNKHVICHFCGVSFHGSYSRVRAHLLQIKGDGVDPCYKMPHHVFKQLQKDEQAGREFILNGATRKTLSLPPYEGPGGPSTSRKRKAAGAGKQQGIAESFNLETKQQADALIARMYYTGGMQICCSSFKHGNCVAVGCCPY